VLDARQLVERKKVIAGDATKSRLFKKVQAGEMPPEDEKARPTADEIAVLKAWIDAGAPAFTDTSAQRAPLSEKDAIVAVRDHLRALPAEDQPFQRYFTLAHLQNNPAVSDEDLRWQRAALAKAVNSLSWKPRIVVPRAIDKAEAVFAVDVRDLDWDRRRVW